ncbi:hypothetical protein SGLAD_v1c03770 [Spiroplasma gladiatoris]|uniref:DUF192 domain-containing protein n=1 Tax=Spiroplasma gladiatoris TaxID=2143 RepID=A0A4P7AIU8_9MOLU|nr:hypothetical protein [Spiroplasma gladiatoris]QBQ07576.1 hypothetical protein SGLAD_v1c03770 [Spiroplasma gladiatoris]
MGLVKKFKGVVNFMSDSKKVQKKRVDENKVYQLVINNQIKDINIRNIKTIKQKFNALILKEKFNHTIGFRFLGLKGFNSFGFKYEVDLIFCDKKYQVIETYSSFLPNKVTEHHSNAVIIFVLAKHSIKYLNIKLNDLIKITKY